MKVRLFINFIFSIFFKERKGESVIANIFVEASVLNEFLIGENVMQ